MHGSKIDLLAIAIFFLIGIPACIAWFVSLLVCSCSLRPGTEDRLKQWSAYCMYLLPFVLIVPACLLAMPIMDAMRIYDGILVVALPIWTVFLVLWLVVRKINSRQSSVPTSETQKVEE